MVASRRRTVSRRPRAGGGGGLNIGKYIPVLLLLGAMFAFYQIPHNPTVQGLWAILASKSDTVKQWVTDFGDDFVAGNPIDIGGGDGIGSTGSGGSTGGTGTTDPATPVPTTELDAVKTNLTTVTTADAKDVDYNRDEWKHWVNVRSCWTVREQVLFDEAVKDASLKMLDANGAVVADVNAACSIESGTWLDIYTGKTINNPKEIDIDHMIPLSYAAHHGAQEWTAAKKSEYANNLTYVNHLVAVSASANRSKSDKGPSEWKPEDKSYWCQYAISWITVSTNYQLSATASDKTALTEMLNTCPVS
jgi:Protein of unknown function (DUF1524)